MTYRDRIKEFRRVAVERLIPHEKNWREHPPEQIETMRAVLAEIGYADALLVIEAGDGCYRIVDGHLRAEVSPDQDVPVLVLDLDQREADQVLLTHDPLAGMAKADEALLAELIASTDFQCAEIRAMLDLLSATNSTCDLDDASVASNEPEIGAMFQVAVQCRDEAEQERLFKRLTGEGYACRLLTM